MSWSFHYGRKSASASSLMRGGRSCDSLYASCHGRFTFNYRHLHSGAFAGGSLSYRESNQYDDFGQLITRQTRGEGFTRARSRGRSAGRSRGRGSRSLTKCFLPQIDPSPGDWLCPRCKCINYRGRPHCLNCGLFVSDEFARWSFEDGTPWKQPPPFVPHPGDWKCATCNKWNFKDQLDCYSCGNAVSNYCESVPLPALCQGQFYCAQCSTLNFAIRKTCIKCEAHRPHSAGPAHGTTRGNWRCPDCKFKNMGLCEKCSSCGRPLDSRCKIQNGCHKQVIQGDWMCPQCFYCNILENEKCLRCHEAKGPAARNIVALEAFSALPGDWVCSKCIVANSRFDSTCFLCCTDREAEAFETQYDRNLEKMKRQAIPFDWECSTCHHYVFAFRETCPTCPGSTRKLSHCFPAKEWRDAQLGDWRCESCGTTTGQSSNRCFRCGTHRSYRSETVTTTVLNGNFVCEKCHRPNINFRTECVQCGTVRGFGAGVKSPDQWICVDCHALNLSWMCNCFFCHTKRPVNEN